MTTTPMVAQYLARKKEYPGESSGSSGWALSMPTHDDVIVMRSIPYGVWQTVCCCSRSGTFTSSSGTTRAGLLMYV